MVHPGAKMAHLGAQIGHLGAKMMHLGDILGPKLDKNVDLGSILASTWLPKSTKNRQKIDQNINLVSN